MTALRARRDPRHSLLDPFSSVVLLLFAAHLALFSCGSGQARSPLATSSSAEGPRAKAPTAPARRSGSAPVRGSEASIASSVHVALGTPRDTDPSDEYFLDEHSYVLSYSPEKRVPNWVAWRLDRTHLGHVRRQGDFREDLALPERFYRVRDSDYSHSGYDRGHMCPSADRRDTVDANSQTFLFTNIEPQLHELNAGPWEQLERYARQRAEGGAVLYVVAGGVFGASFPTIGNGVAVPAANFKIIVVLEREQGPSDVDEHTEVLAVSMPNQRGVGEHEWRDYATTVDAIEQASGYDFLNAIPERVQRVIEARMPALGAARPD